MCTATFIPWAGTNSLNSKYFFVNLSSEGSLSFLRQRLSHCIVAFILINFLMLLLSAITLQLCSCSLCSSYLRMSSSTTSLGVRSSTSGPSIEAQWLRLMCTTLLLSTETCMGTSLDLVITEFSLQVWLTMAKGIFTISSSLNSFSVSTRWTLGSNKNNHQQITYFGTSLPHLVYLCSDARQEAS